MEDLLFEINETARAIRRAFDQKAAGFGVTRVQWKTLARLKRQPGLRQVELAEILEMEPITLCRVIDRLEEVGLVERKADPADRRAWRLETTAKAEPLIRKLKTVAAELTAEALSGLSDDETEQFHRDLLKIRGNVAAVQQKKRATA
jgi:DNA-binding MarR family transcriptional regulator